MEKKTEIHYAIIKGKGNKGHWIFPVETNSASAKEMRDDGIQINLAENEFVRTDSMKVYAIDTQGDNKKWVLLSPLEPEIAQGMKASGLLIDEILDEKIEEGLIVKKVQLAKKDKPKGEMTE